MRRTSKAVSVLGVIGLCAVIGCATAPSLGEPPDGTSAVDPGGRPPGEVADQQIALDFANAILQIETLSPRDTVLRFAREDDEVPVLGALRLMLAEAGYAVQRVDGGGDRDVVRYRVDTDGHGRGARRHEISIGEIGLRRVYRDAGGDRVRPVSELFVKGADPGSIRMLDEQLFGIDPVEGVPPDAPSGEGAPPSTVSDDLLVRYEHLMANEGDDATRLRAAAAAAEAGDVGTGGTVSLVPVRNVRELGESNFASALDARELVVEHVVTFERASDRLDRDDVALIDDLLARFDPETDLITVTGYSAGGAPSIERNRDWAMRRANSIKGALTAAGVPHERVLTEGYWSDTLVRDENVPGRAAVVRLSRRPAPS